MGTVIDLIERGVVILDNNLEAYPSLPVTMYGSAVSIWLSNKNVGQYESYLPKGVEINQNNEIRLRIWDLKMDSETEMNLTKKLVNYSFKEAVLAIPSMNGKIFGEYPLHMYSDSFLYTSLARETIGWNVKEGEIYSNIESELKPGQNIETSAKTDWNFKLNMSIKSISLSEENESLPEGTWFANKIVASPFSKENYSEELIIGGSSEIKVEKIWTGDGNFEMSDNLIDNQIIREESEINKVEIWENLEMSVGYAQK